MPDMFLPWGSGLLSPSRAAWTAFLVLRPLLFQWRCSSALIEALLNLGRAEQRTAPRTSPWGDGTHGTVELTVAFELSHRHGSRLQISWSPAAIPRSQLEQGDGA
uniref:Uncharacterized protein n=1 Tax=Chaetomium tenue TaxID=1854479 RepID=A0ACB7P9B8_9PEZI|nr:hypothetical protein F5144DRAFT_593367 [Chaetomium globosum]